MSQLMERAYFGKGIMLQLLFILLFDSTGFPFLAMAQSTDVHIIDLVFKNAELPEDVATAYNHGFNASILERNSTLAGRKVNIISMNATKDNVSSGIEQAIGSSKDLFVVLGPGTTELTEAALPALNKKDVVAFGPLTKKPRLRIWNEHLYYFLRSTAIAAYTLMRHAVINMRVRRVGVMYTTDTLYGNEEHKLLTRLMKTMNRELCGVFSIDGSAFYAPDDKGFNEAWETFAETRPQVVIVLGSDNSATKLFIQKVLDDPRTRSTDLMLTYEESMILDIWDKARAHGTLIYNGRMFAISTLPDSFGNSSAMVNKFSPIIDKYFQDRVDKGYDKVKGKPTGWEDDSATLAGWVTGEILFQALAGFNAALSRKEFIASLYNQRTYVIDELVVGTFGGNISEGFKQAGADAFCNEGARSAYLRQFSDPKNITSIPIGDYVFSMRVCNDQDMKLTDPAAIVTVNFTDVVFIGHYMMIKMTRGQIAGLDFLDPEPRHDMTLRVLQATYDNSTSTVKKECENYLTNILTGLVVEETLDIPNVTFIDPIPTDARMHKFRRNVVFLSPTVEQQIFVLVQYVASLPDRTIRAVIRSASGNEALDILRKSLLTFGLTLTSWVLLKPGDAIENAMGSHGVTLMIYVNEVDIPIFVAHLERNKKARLAVLFDPLLGYYENLRAAFKDNEAAERFLIITNLPHWADANSQSVTVRNYHKSISNSSDWSPLSLQSFIVGRFIRRVVEEVEVVNWSSLADYFYAAIVVHLDDMSFGPFADSKSVTCTSDSDPNSLGCAKNFGATSISIWSMSRVYDPNVGVLFGPVTPSMEYSLSTGLTRAQQIAVTVGSLLGAAVLAAVLGVLLYCFCTGNSNAPKDREKPVTLIFTDIQSSTTLWAVCPEIMPDAVETHHRLIRRLIAKYKCYEVKTVGDSFMIACKSPYAAVKLVDDLQRTFLEYNWGTSAFDKAYHDFEEAQAEEDADYKPPTARLDDAVYRELWRGLRVRAGVHTGLSDIQRDEVTGRYDYYGSTSNTAARTESIANGGQVLLTRATYMALRTAERAGLNVTALGAVELRGVPEPVGMLQLNPVPGRTFAKLRLERANDEFDFEECSVNGTETSGSVSEVLTPAGENVFEVLHDICVSFPPQQRLKALEPFCRRWNVKIPVVKNQEDVLGASRVATQRLAMKVSRVLERRQLTQGSINDASEIVSSARGSLLMQNMSRTSSLRESLVLKRTAYRRSVGNEGYGINYAVPFNMQRGSSVVSSTASILVKEPSFLHFN